MKRNNAMFDKIVQIGACLLFLVGLYAVITRSQHNVGEKFILTGVWVIAWFLIVTGMIGTIRGIPITSFRVPVKPTIYCFAVAIVHRPLQYPSIELCFRAWHAQAKAVLL